jgi:hypothetical protein
MREEKVLHCYISSSSRNMNSFRARSSFRAYQVRWSQPVHLHTPLTFVCAAHKQTGPVSS